MAPYKYFSTTTTATYMYLTTTTTTNTTTTTITRAGLSSPNTTHHYHSDCLSTKHDQETAPTVSHSHTTTTSSIHAVAGPWFWNTLPAELRQPDIELVTFRSG